MQRKKTVLPFQVQYSPVSFLFAGSHADVQGSEESGHPSRDRKKTNACGDGRTRHMPRRMPGTARCRKRRKIEFSPNTDQHVFLPDSHLHSLREVTDGVNIHLLQPQSTSRRQFQSSALRRHSSEPGSPRSGHQRNAHATYYASLRLAIAAARDELGDELTRWRSWRWARVTVEEEVGEGEQA
ncbi:hypothetical protein C8J56DRAFT_1025639 [Mycena floridula]|nr:hypothetical protein C8J56DRAFT_1025639 [Mycena floridula]